MNSKSILSALIIFCWQVPIFGLQVDEEKEDLDRLQALSLLKACRESASAIVKGDCLIKIQAAYDTLQTSQLNEIAEKFYGRSFQRVAFDFEAKQFLRITHSTGTKMTLQPDLSNGKDAEFIQEKLMGAVVNEKFGYLRSLPDPKYRTEHKTGYGEFLESIFFPDVRLVGFTDDLGQGRLFSKRDQYEARAIALAENFESIETLGSGRVRLRFHFDIPNSSNKKEYIQVSTYEIDSEKFVILMFEIEIREKETGKFLSRSIKSNIEWAEHHGLNLPRRISTTKPRFIKIDGKDVGALEENTRTFHWFSCNEELNETLFDHSILDDSTEMLRLADPKATKAKTFDDQDD